MFELPEAKRVRRADPNAWGDSAGSESDGEGYDVELQAKLNAQIARSLGLDESHSQAWDVTSTPSHFQRHHQPDLMDVEVEVEVEVDAEEEGAGNEEFAFRMFSSTQPSQKVVLEEDTGPKGVGGFAHPRPLSYYMLTNLTSNQKQQYAFAAMSGDEVLARSKDRPWGLEQPWKVTKIAVTRKRKPEESVCMVEGETEKKKKKPRPGKKQRILLRNRAKADEERKRAEAQKLLDKEEHSKDKKKRMNRLKKLRKRAKNKEMKLATKDGEAGGAGESGDDSEGSD
ncbi:hypothetical protein AK830_g11387 [Neonectria ditissima]|uniref:Uncharacterized protein n=1 Tax=Neonectria ditissima TaxID=78410 RepID=A0A0P7B1J2_9HYPO|nr:hypothetical protein AK830_g11387 [Neonectria ditissima]